MDDDLEINDVGFFSVDDLIDDQATESSALLLLGLGNCGESR